MRREVSRAETVLGILIAFIVIGLIAYGVDALTGKYEWKGRPWVRLQPAEVIVESTLVVKDSIRADFIVPDDSSTVHLAGWADSSNFALNADSLGGSIVADDVLLSSRIDSTSYNFYHLGQTFLQGNVTISQDKYLFLKNSTTSSLKYDGTDGRVEWINANDVELVVRAETLLVESDGEVGPAVVFSDSSGDDLLTIYNEGGITLAKDWQGIGIWAANNFSETLAVVGITTSSIVLVTSCNTGIGYLSWDCWTDTCIVGRTVETLQDSFGYLILK